MPICPATSGPSSRNASGGRSRPKPRSRYCATTLSSSPDPGRHPAIFADHGVVHVRDVAIGLTRLLDTINGVLLPYRPAHRQRFVQALGVGLAYLHDIGMVDMTRSGRRVHALFAAHAAFGPDVDPLVEHLLATGPGRRPTGRDRRSGAVRDAARDRPERDAQHERRPQQVRRPVGCAR